MHLTDTFVQIIRMPREGVFPLVHFDAPPAQEQPSARRAATATPPPRTPSYEVGVQIADYRTGASYLVTVDRRGNLTSRFDAALASDADYANINWMRNEELAARARAFLDRRDDWIASRPFAKAEIEDRLSVGLLRYGEEEEQASLPTLETFAREARLARAAGVALSTWFAPADQRHPERAGHPWKMASRTVSRWLERCRDAGVLHEDEFPRKVGRPRTTDRQES